MVNPSEIKVSQSHNRHIKEAIFFLHWTALFTSSPATSRWRGRKQRRERERERERENEREREREERADI